MNASAILVFVTAAFTALLAVGVLVRGRRSATNYFFFGGMACLAAKSLFDGLSIHNATAAEAVRWQGFALLAKSFGPALWLCFSLTYSRGNYREFLSRWRWVLFVAFLLPLIISAAFQEDLFSLDDGGIQVSESGRILALKLGPAGKVLNLFFLVAIVLTLTNLEKTFRTAVGTLRWRIKFVVLGLCVVFGAKIYTTSQALLYSQIHISLTTVEAGALLLGCALMTISYVRSGLSEIDVYPSHAFLYSSITVVISGVYLLVVGLFARLVVAAGGDAAFPVKAFFVLVAIVGLSVLLLSNRLRQKTQHFVSRHFARPLYDYRKIWTLFTEKTASATNPNSLCAATAKLISDTFNVLSVTIWLVNENDRSLVFGASTSLESEHPPSTLPPNPESSALGHAAPPPSSAPAHESKLLHTYAKVSSPENAAPAATATVPLAAESFPFDSFLSTVRQRPYPSDLDKSTEDWAKSLRQLNPGTFRKGGNRVSVPIVANDQVLGVMILADRVSGIPFSLEELDLVRCIGGHVAASLLGLQLSEKLMHAKEQEAFRAVSTFFAHDLKNAASSLSLVLQNLPKHFDDPEFRADVLRGLGRTVNHMNHLITRLSVFREKPEIMPVACDLNEVVGSALSRWEAIPGIELSKRLEPMPKALLDRDQVQNVITNLLLNARDALGSRGEIRIETARQNGWAVLTVSDNGCGMAPEFLRHSLFRPFKTTKKGGTGIGMFQCKTIVEAHRGRIEVESEPGKGTSFRILLPLHLP